VLWSIQNLDAAAPDRVLVNIPNASLWQARLSPNRRWVSFVSVPADPPGTTELMVTSIHGSSPGRLIRIAADHTWPDKPRWAADGRTLYFISRRPGPYFNLWAVRFNADLGTPVGEPYALSAFDSPALHVSPQMARAEMDVSAQHVVLTMQAVTGSIWLLDGVDR
jgi:hypothetical protein